MNYKIALWALVVISFLIMLVTVLDLSAINPLKESKFLAGMQFVVVFNLVKQILKKRQLR